MSEFLISQFDTLVHPLFCSKVSNSEVGNGKPRPDLVFMPGYRRLNRGWRERISAITDDPSRALIYCSTLYSRQMNDTNKWYLYGREEVERISKLQERLGARVVILGWDMSVRDVKDKINNQNLRYNTETVRGQTYGEILEECVKNYGGIVKNAIGILDYNYMVRDGLSMSRADERLINRQLNQVPQWMLNIYKKVNPWDRPYFI